jgi:hypothetical protein
MQELGSRKFYFEAHSCHYKKSFGLDLLSIVNERVIPLGMVLFVEKKRDEAPAPCRDASGKFGLKSKSVPSFSPLSPFVSEEHPPNAVLKSSPQRLRQSRSTLCYTLNGF